MRSSNANFTFFTNLDFGGAHSSTNTFKFFGLCLINGQEGAARRLGQAIVLHDPGVREKGP